MQATTASHVTNLTMATTKSREQILIQNSAPGGPEMVSNAPIPQPPNKNRKGSGAMIAIIVIGIIIILSILLIILKTYNKKMHTRRMLSGTSSKPRKNTTSTTTMTTLPMENMRGSANLGGFAHLPNTLENGFRLPRAEAANTSRQVSMTSGSTVVTIHNTPSIENT